MSFYLFWHLQSYEFCDASASLHQPSNGREKKMTPLWLNGEYMGKTEINARHRVPFSFKELLYYYLFLYYKNQDAVCD